MVWEPSKCCCCCISPNTGTFVLGYLGVISAVFGVVSSLLKSNISKEEAGNQCNFEGHVTSVEECYKMIVNTAITGAAEELIRGIICVMLILGLYKKNYILMIPYMIFQVIAIVLGSILILILVIVLAVYDLGLYSFIMLVVGALLIFLETFFFLVVRVSYKEVKNASLQTSAGGIEVGPSHQTSGCAIELGLIHPKEALLPPPYKSSEKALLPPPYNASEKALLPPPYKA